MLRNLKKRQEGFTIIEVMIVLVIAAAILLIVFLAVPALQRNSRNTQRKNDISKMLGGVAEFVTNNNGAVPAVACVATAPSYNFRTGTCATPTGTGAEFKLGYYAVAPTVTATAIATAPTTDIATIVTGNKCAATAGTTTATGASTRSIAVVYMVETGAGLAATCQES